jgi:hypothetical protein
MHKMYERFPDSRQRTRVMLTRYVSEMASLPGGGGGGGAVAPSSAAANAPIDARGRPPQHRPNARDDVSLKRRAVMSSARLYASQAERQPLAGLPTALDLLAAIGAGLARPAAPLHSPCFDAVRRLVFRDGMIDEMTPLAALFHASLKRCIAAWISQDASGSLAQSVVESIERQWSASVVRACH